MHDNDESPDGLRARPVLPWPGGKGKLLKHILPHIPPHVCYVEPFAGSLAVFIAKAPSVVEIVNDINGDLVKFYRNVKLHKEAILDELDLVLNARQEFEDYLAQPGLTEIQRAARWFLVHKLSFGGMGRHFAVGKTHALSSREKRILAIRALAQRLDRTTVENRSWEQIFKLYDSPDSFFFLDPPYLDAGGSAYAGWSELELERFASAVRELQGAWLLSYQDCPAVRAAFKGYEIRAISRANGIGNNGRQRGGRVYREVFISSPARALARKAA